MTAATAAPGTTGSKLSLQYGSTDRNDMLKRNSIIQSQNMSALDSQRDGTAAGSQRTTTPGVSGSMIDELAEMLARRHGNQASLERAFENTKRVM